MSILAEKIRSMFPDSLPYTQYRSPHILFRVTLLFLGIFFFSPELDFQLHATFWEIMRAWVNFTAICIGSLVGGVVLIGRPPVPKESLRDREAMQKSNLFDLALCGALLAVVKESFLRGVLFVVTQSHWIVALANVLSGPTYNRLEIVANITTSLYLTSVASSMGLSACIMITFFFYLVMDTIGWAGFRDQGETSVEEIEKKIDSVFGEDDN